MRRWIIALGAALSGVAAAPAVAETELSLYIGWQTAPHSRVEGSDPVAGVFSRAIGWDGKSFEMPPYYGGRITFWRTESFGWGFEATHAKAYMPAADRAALGFDRFELTDGHNIVTVNAQRRWKDRWGGFTPYVGAGLGVAIPHVDVQATGGGPRTFGYQLTGPAVRLFAGASYDITENWAAFGEYQFTASWNDVDLDSGGSFETDLYTNAINLGVSYRF